MRRGLTFLLMLVVVLMINAKPRTMTELRQAAAAVLQRPSSMGISQVARRVDVLQQRAGLYVMGYEEGGFAIMAEDDRLPAVLGYSDTPYHEDTDNQNFRWWLSQVEYMASHPADTPILTIRPDTSRFAASVAPMVKTLWNQDSPYNNLCPNYCPTGCVATATAQVLKYFEWPQYGQGTVCTYYPFGNFEGRKIEEHIEGVEYQYDKMLNSYTVRSATAAQKEAVATLMYHVGLAMKAQYSGESTGSYNESICYGLRNNLGYPYAVTVDKDNYTAQEWMDMIFQSLNDGCPLIYGGSDDTYTGHEFVLHGYNHSGLIYINWGWGGEDDGYYDLSSLLLYWGIYNFNSYQNMLLGVNKSSLIADTVRVHVETPGTLSDILGERLDSVACMVVSGNINSSDLKILRHMAGCSVTGKGTMGCLSKLDMSDATIVSGGDAYLMEDMREYTTTDDEMPYKAFSGCVKLISVILPKNLRHYDIGVFAGCNNLDSVTLTATDVSDFVVSGCYVMNKERTELIEGLPCQDVHYVIPNGVRRIHDYAFAGRFLYERISLPATLDSIGKYAFNRCFDLSRTYLSAEEPPVIDPTAIDDLDLSLRTLYVPKGTRNKYMNTDGWKKYGFRGIKEFVPFDGIKELKAVTNHKHTVYDINGRPATLPAAQKPELRGSVYIVDGKKYIVR